MDGLTSYAFASPSLPHAVRQVQQAKSATAARASCSSGLSSAAIPAAAAYFALRRRRSLLPRKVAAGTGTEKSDEEAFQELVAWLRARGAYIDDAFGLISTDPVAGEAQAQKERGCAATRDVRNGELLLEIPVSCCLAAPPGTADALVADPAVAAALESAGISSEDAALALAVAHERKSGDQSGWWPYLRMLGDCRETFPLFFEEDDLDALDNPPLKESFQVTSKAIASVAALRGISDKELRSAWQLVISRRFGSELGRVMVPVGDFTNHSFYPSAGWEPPTAQRPDSWICRAKIDIAAGESINWTYCEDPNHLLLSTLGCVMKENPHSRIMVRPSDLRKALELVCNDASPADFKTFREAEIKKLVPAVEEEGVGLSMFLVGRRPGGLQWNPLWLDLVGLAVCESGEKHFSQEVGGTERYLDALETASWSVFSRGKMEDDPGAPSAKPNQVLAADLRLGQKALLRDAVAGIRTRLAS